MFRALQLLAILGLVYAAAACSTGTSAVVSDLGFVGIEPEEFRAKKGKIILASTTVLVNLQDTGPVEAEYDSLVEASFLAAGFSVVRAAEFDDIIERVTEQVGGVFDPNTGETDSAKVRTVYQQAIKEIRDKINPDAVIVPTIEAVAVGFSQTSKIKWLGTSECLSPAVAKVFGLCAPKDYSGQLSALAFFVTIFDMNAAVMFRNGGGIQILQKHYPLRRVPRHELFADKKRNIAAVKIALDPFSAKM